MILRSSMDNIALATNKHQFELVHLHFTLCIIL